MFSYFCNRDVNATDGVNKNALVMIYELAIWILSSGLVTRGQRVFCFWKVSLMFVVSMLVWLVCCIWYCVLAQWAEPSFELFVHCMDDLVDVWLWFGALFNIRPLSGMRCLK